CCTLLYSRWQYAHKSCLQSAINQEKKKTAKKTSDLINGQYTLNLKDKVILNCEVKNFAVIYLVDITEVPDFNKMYELYDPCTVMFFFRSKHIMIDLGTGNNNKINWTMEDKQEMIDIVETVYRGARKGRGLVVSPKDYSTKYRY
uniref:Thioredoxin-like protein 4A n=1 Tax=Sinocyclocheilus grahami TaxID=75366 RepID=A0A672S0M3_SINGR